VDHDEEKHLDPEIEYFLTCLAPNTLYIIEFDDQPSKEIHGMEIKAD